MLAVPSPIKPWGIWIAATDSTWASRDPDPAPDAAANL
jgi:hypothetical protein